MGEVLGRILKPARHKQHNKNKHQDAKNTDAAMTEAVTVAAEAPTEPAQQEDDEKDERMVPIDTIDLQLQLQNV